MIVQHHTDRLRLRPGVTLLELLAVLAVLGTLAAISAIGLRAAARGAPGPARDRLTLARRAAIASGSPRLVRVEDQGELPIALALPDGSIRLDSAARFLLEASDGTR
jgi:prepilin-type N-terminal cleavage/methylation domain-containing protein